MSISGCFGQSFQVQCTYDTNKTLDFSVCIPLDMIVKLDDDVHVVLFTDEERDKPIISYVCKWCITHLNLTNFDQVEAYIPSSDGRDRFLVTFNGLNCEVEKL